MATIDDYFASRQCVWGDFTASGNISVRVSEIRRSRISNSVYQTFTHAIPNESIPAWLSSVPDFQVINNHSDRKEDTCMLRIVWFPYNRKDGKIDVGHGVLSKVTQAFHHHLAQSRFRATFAGASSVVEPSNGNQTYWFCNHPHLAVTWSRDPGSHVTNVIVIAQPSKIAMLQDLISCQFIQELASFDLLPSLLCLILLCREIDNLLSDVKSQVRQAEVRTGHHCFMSRAETPAAGDLLQLSAVMSGCMSNLAVLTRRLGVLGTLKKWTDDVTVEMGEEKSMKASLAAVTTILSTVQQHSVMQQLDIEFFKKRTQTQHDALLHLIGEQGNLASRGLAQDSYSLAMLARKDTSMMKGLAFLAAVFVPPAFVSSLLSIPLFDWGSTGEDAEGSSPPLGTKVLIYLSITGPLMLITFAIWGIFLCWERSERRVRFDTSESTGYQEAAERSEMISLIAKRRLYR
ncbi:hypothetical protein NM208_g1637 [Fusarium decemcellulare]|uniref:Uncharacterized protein n=2 Tax=Fusarium decemcellulare TaxID=57161 RepID=A0ACC1STU3_9HYPO|nr:hypothetical protein NM208_g2081 [Fusarium decemcellulare]KAJ3547192.1 hypothetical protein NM208_g1637 [Fusarium decemcellulare]